MTPFFLIIGTFAAFFSLVAEMTAESLFPHISPLTSWSDPLTPLPTLVAGIILFAAMEEILKFAVLRRGFTMRGTDRTIPESLSFALGFAGTEIVFLFLSTDAALPSIMTAAVGIAFIHGVTSTAYGLRIINASRRTAASFLLLGIFFHAAYNILLALIR